MSSRFPRKSWRHVFWYCTHNKYVLAVSKHLNHTSVLLLYSTSLSIKNQMFIYHAINGTTTCSGIVNESRTFRCGDMCARSVLMVWWPCGVKSWAIEWKYVACISLFIFLVLKSVVVPVPVVVYMYFRFGVSTLIYICVHCWLSCFHHILTTISTVFSSKLGSSFYIRFEVNFNELFKTWLSCIVLCMDITQNSPRRES